MEYMFALHSRNWFRWCCVAAALTICGASTRRVTADVIVLANRTDRPVPLRFFANSGGAQPITLLVGDVVPVFVDGPGRVEFASPGAPKQYALDANCAYYFGRAADGRIDLQKIGLGEDGTALAGRKLPGTAVGPAATITVKIVVDEEEPARRNVWERRLTKRIEAASAILEKFCGVRLKVVATDTWNSNNDTNDLIESLSEFESEVSPAPARLAIGFTNQYQMVRGRTHMAGTRGPLHTHILAREGSPQISEAEKLEFLVHELGHFLGAAHSPERNSVMRPVLGDNLAGRSDFRIKFDPVNALAVAMVGEEIRRRGIQHISELDPTTKRRLRQIYTELAKSIPEDPAGSHYARLMGTSAGSPQSLAAKRVLQAIVSAAAANRALPTAPARGTGGVSRREGDALTEYYVREACRAADALPDDVASRALLLALAVGLDRTASLRSNPAVAENITAIETPSERAMRIELLGAPTVRGRADFAQQFFNAAYLAAVQNTEAAHAAGTAKEVVDAQGPAGFDFAGIAATRAGARFGMGVTRNRFPLPLLAKSFEVATFVPTIDGLPGSLSTGELKAKFGGTKGAEFVKQERDIDRRIDELPPYKPSTIKLIP